jgi:hypothetical protein
MSWVTSAVRWLRYNHWVLARNRPKTLGFARKYLRTNPMRLIGVLGECRTTAREVPWLCKDERPPLASGIQYYAAEKKTS